MFGRCIDALGNGDGARLPWQLRVRMMAKTWMVIMETGYQMGNMVHHNKSKGAASDNTDIIRQEKKNNKARCTREGATGSLMLGRKEQRHDVWVKGKSVWRCNRERAKELVIIRTLASCEMMSSDW